MEVSFKNGHFGYSWPASIMLSGFLLVRFCFFFWNAWTIHYQWFKPVWTVIFLVIALPSCCEQSLNMVNHVCINVNHSIIWWLTIWKPCHRHDITMEYRSIVRLNETSCRSWYHLLTWYHGPTRHHLYM